MMENNPDPRSTGTARRQAGRRVPPGETPPGESSMSGAGPNETHNPTKGWGKGPTIAIWLLVLCFAVFFVAYAVVLL
ncbi:hypothetical protein IHE55_29400 [Streptomyces pactum]|uniref:Uncharacterized protein n=1 Tax=Streptomyces pactum TaxID=68249 RepID=A0ABS0NUF7_9ACTN|nr:DUF6480 family protein [Streptomyces pactum]MBH5338674.1 hypothetical protein [Streptomyces pactum]